MLFAKVYDKLLKMVLLQLALNVMFSSSKVVDPSRSSQVKSKIAPPLKINFRIHRIKFHAFIKICTIGLLTGCTMSKFEKQLVLRDKCFLFFLGMLTFIRINYFIILTMIYYQGCVL